MGNTCAARAYGFSPTRFCGRLFRCGYGRDFFLGALTFGVIAPMSLLTLILCSKTVLK